MYCGLATHNMLYAMMGLLKEIYSLSASCDVFGGTAIGIQSIIKKGAATNFIYTNYILRVDNVMYSSSGCEIFTATYRRYLIV